MSWIATIETLPALRADTGFSSEVDIYSLRLGSIMGEYHGEDGWISTMCAERYGPIGDVTHWKPKTVPL